MAPRTILALLVTVALVACGDDGAAPDAADTTPDAVADASPTEADVDATTGSGDTPGEP